MTRLLCTGDLHLGHGTDLGRQPGDRLRDQETVLIRIASLASEYHVDAILNCGDTFEGPAVTPEQLDVYAGFVGECAFKGIPIVAITGNGKHDAAMRDVNGVQIFDHIEGITVHSRPGFTVVGDTWVACLPWVHPGRLVAAQNGDTDRDEVNREAAELLVAAARGLRAQIPDGKSAVLAYHGSISGAALPNGLPVDDLREPVLEWGALDALGFDAIVCGHIHKTQRLGDEQAASTGFYTGSPLPLNFGEAHDEHGVWILDIDEKIRPHRVHADFQPIESRRFVTHDVDFTGTPNGFHSQRYEDIYPYLAQRGEGEVDGSIVRFRYRATSEQARGFDNVAMRRAFLDQGAHVVRIEPEIVREDRARVEGVDESLDPLQALELYVAANGIEENLAEAMRERMEKYLELVPS